MWEWERKGGSRRRIVGGKYAAMGDRGGAGYKAMKTVGGELRIYCKVNKTRNIWFLGRREYLIYILKHICFYGPSLIV